METEVDLDQASRETLLEVIAQQQGIIAGLRQQVESLEVRLSGGGPGARMPGHKPAARRKEAAEEEKKPRPASRTPPSSIWPPADAPCAPWVRYPCQHRQ